MYYRVAIQVSPSSSWQWKSTVLNIIKLFAQGYVATAPGARALLVAHMGDTTTVTSFPPVSSGKVFEQEVLQELKAIIPAGVDVQTTLFLLAERYSSDAYFNIATLDLSLDPGTV